MSDNQNQSVHVDAEKPRLLGFLRDLVQADLNESCRRQFQRHSLRLSLSVQPLTEDFQPDGEAFKTMSSDISLKGMAFVNPEEVQHEYIRVAFSQFDISIIARIKHNSSIGVDYPLYLVGVEFLDEYYD
ncbi:MAG: PilZ domain-containing protein [Planctomycetota bacterium]